MSFNDSNLNVCKLPTSTVGVIDMCVGLLPLNVIHFLSDCYRIQWEDIVMQEDVCASACLFDYPELVL